jgi:hypothetical protein
MTMAASTPVWADQPEFQLVEPARTRIFYDTEFIENGRTIDLISIGLVSETGGEYYAISSEFDHQALLGNPWLIENVLPSLPYRRHEFGLAAESRFMTLDYDHPDRPAVKRRSRIAQEVRGFILGEATGSVPELWAWYAAYDHVALCQLWGPMINLPEGIPMFTCDLRQEVARQGDPRLPDQPAGVHNALADARHNVVRARALGLIA